MTRASTPFPHYLLVFSDQQYLLKQLAQTPSLATLDLFRARSTTAQARQAGHSGSILLEPELPCMAIAVTWFSIS